MLLLALNTNIFWGKKFESSSASKPYCRKTHERTNINLVMYFYAFIINVTLVINDNEAVDINY